MDRMTDTFLVPSYFISYFPHHSVHSVHQLNFWIIKSQLLRNKTHDVCAVCVMCVCAVCVCDVCAVCNVCDVCVLCVWCVCVLSYGGDEATLSREVCVSQVHTVCSWQGVEGRLLTLFYYYILTFLIFSFFFFSLPDSTETRWLANLDCLLFLELTKMTSNFTVLSKYQNIL